MVIDMMGSGVMRKLMEKVSLKVNCRSDAL